MCVVHVTTTYLHSHYSHSHTTSNLTIKLPDIKEINSLYFRFDILLKFSHEDSKIVKLIRFDVQKCLSPQLTQDAQRLAVYRANVNFRGRSESNTVTHMCIQASYRHRELNHIVASDCWPASARRAQGRPTRPTRTHECVRLPIDQAAATVSNRTQSPPQNQGLLVLDG